MGLPPPPRPLCFSTTNSNIASVQFTKKMLWNTLHRKHAYGNIPNLPRCWKTKKVTPPRVQMLSTSDPTTLHHPGRVLLPCFFGYLCDCVDLQVNIIGRYLLSLDDLKPEAPSCVFYATCCKVHWKFETVDGDSSTLIWYQTLTNTHAERTQGPKGW